MLFNIGMHDIHMLQLSSKVFQYTDVTARILLHSNIEMALSDFEQGKENS